MKSRRPQWLNAYCLSEIRLSLVADACLMRVSDHICLVSKHVEVSDYDTNFTLQPSASIDVCITLWHTLDIGVEAICHDHVLVVFLRDLTFDVLTSTSAPASGVLRACPAIVSPALHGVLFAPSFSLSEVHIQLPQEILTSRSKSKSRIIATFEVHLRLLYSSFSSSPNH